jgi:hypothetical protein
MNYVVLMCDRLSIVVLPCAKNTCEILNVSFKIEQLELKKEMQ